MAASSAVAMAGIISSTPSILSSSLASKPSSYLPQRAPPVFTVRADAAQQQEWTSRRALLSFLVASFPASVFAKEALAEVTFIKIAPPPPPSGGLPGTENVDQASDTDLALKERFYLQPLPPQAAAERAKDCAKDILAVKTLIDKKAWPFVQNDLRLKASYLRYDLNTVISAKPKDERKALKLLVTKLFDNMDNLDYAARAKSVPKAEKYYAETVSSLNELLAKLG